MSTLPLPTAALAPGSGLRAAVIPLAASLLGRLPVAALGLVLLLHTRALGGSPALGGAVVAAFALGLAVGGPVLGRLADRRGGPPVLLGATAASAVALGALALVPRATSAAVLLALAGAAGLVHPPVGGMIRSAWPRLLGTNAAARVHAIESSALELTYIGGPALIGGVLGAQSTRLALAACAALLVAGTAALTANPAIRAATRPPATDTGAASDPPRPRRGALASRGVLVLTLAFAAFGASLGAVEVAVATTARQPAVAGLLLALWSLGSLAGAAVMARWPPRTPARRRLVALAAAWGVMHTLVALAVPFGATALGLALLIGGTAVAPCFATAYGLLATVATAGTTAEAFSWLATGIAVGVGVGSALAGGLADAGGTGASFAAGAVTPLLAAALLRARRDDLVAA